MPVGVGAQPPTFFICAFRLRPRGVVPGVRAVWQEGVGAELTAVLPQQAAYYAGTP